jgi:menaquinone-dependent protoporphyrinogen oxidase
MKPAAIVYATSEGHTRRIADRLALSLKTRGVVPMLFDVRDAADVAPAGFAAVVLAASAHRGRHQREMVRYARQNRSQLAAIPNAFISVSLSEAGVENPALSEEERRKHSAAVRNMVARFVKDTGWRPRRVLPVAGALCYTRYNFLMRWIMQRIARSARGATDTSRDHDYTDWAALDRFAGTLASEVLAASTPRRSVCASA